MNIDIFGALFTFRFKFKYTQISLFIEGLPLLMNKALITKTFTVYGIR